MPAISNALVIGGGIGGLTAAIALQRAGIKVDLVEVKPDFSVYGVGIIQPNNMLRALAKIGVAKRCVELGAHFPGWRIYDAHGKHLMDAQTGNPAAPAYPPNNGITRPLLHKVLIESASEAGAKLYLGRHVTDFDDRGDGVLVTFNDGSTANYDFVAGCDGVYSDMRRRVFPEAPRPTFTGQAVWRYNLPRPAGVEWAELYFGPDSKVGLVPMSPTLMYMLLVSAEPGNPRMPEDQLAALMRARLGAYTGLIAELREQITDPADVVYKPMENVMLASPWMKGRVIIIGDAAHATTPHLAQGAAMAIEDAVLLGELLGRDGQFEDLLDEFMARRFDRAKRVVDCSSQIADWELEQWRGVTNPAARPGELLHETLVALMDDY